MFGVGFFIHFVGGNIDRLFFAGQLPQPTYGTGGIMWASMTMALLTLPVVVVSSVEAMRRIPDDLRQASLALGATVLLSIILLLNFLIILLRHKQRRKAG